MDSTNTPAPAAFGFVGTYTRKEPHVDGKATGFYVVDVDENTGRLSVRSVVGPVVNPSYLSLSQDRQNLYVAEEDDPGRVVAYALDNERDLLRLNHLATESAATCHLATDPSDRFVVASNYVGGIVNLYRKDHYGSLTAHQKFDLQPANGVKKSHAHSAWFSRAGDYLFVVDLGLDRIWLYTYDRENERFVPNEPAFLQLPEGAGPRHFCLHPDQQWAYAITEHSNEVMVFDYDKERGLLHLQQIVSTLPAGYDEESNGADLHVHPNGKWLYASNRGHDSIAVFAIEATGKISTLAHVPTGGAVPRGFTVTRDGRFLYVANQNSDNVCQFAIDSETGLLTQVHELSVPTPACITLAR